MSLIDIGANLCNSRFNADIEQILERAAQSGVEAIIVTSSNPEETEAAIKLAERFPTQLYCTAGVHPHDAKDFNEQSY